MKDIRTEKTFPVETDSRLLTLSDTDILLNFSEILSSIYPNLIKVFAHCYDPFDEVTENLFYATVYSTFAGKYGIPLPPKECHQYGFTYENMFTRNHILAHIKPTASKMYSNGASQPLTMPVKDIQAVFIEFGDSINWLSGGEVEGTDYSQVHFKYSNLVLVNPKGEPIPDQQNFCLSNDDLEFELVVVNPSKTLAV